jgi:tetratricopeptide (TPR) repeat protein
VSQARWDEAAADFARELELMPKGGNWETRRSVRALELARWERAYARLLELQPDDGQLWCVRGRYHALRSHWAQAAADFARGVRSVSQENEEWFEHACLRLIVGDNEGYRDAVRETLRGASRPEGPFLAFVWARTASMTAEPVVEPAQAVRWAEHAVARDRNAWNLHVLGLAHYRAGQLDRAIQRLEESNAGAWGSAGGKQQNQLVLAMAHHRLGHAPSARALLDEVERWWKGVETAKTQLAFFNTTDWLPLQLLRREAEAVILYDPVFPADPFAHRQASETPTGPGGAR